MASKVAVDDKGCWRWTAALILGYGAYWLDGQQRRAHRVAWEAVNGAIPNGLEIDHLCGVKACVNPDHLRLATTRQNSQAQPHLQKNNRTGVRGVFWCRRLSKYKAQVISDGKARHLGYHDTLLEAERAALEGRVRAFGVAGLSTPDLVRAGQLGVPLDPSDIEEYRPKWAPLDSERRDLLRSLYAAGEPVGSIVARVGVSEATVRRHTSDLRRLRAAIPHSSPHVRRAP